MRLLKYIMSILMLIVMVSCFGGSDTSSNGSGSEIVGNVDSSGTRITLGDSRIAVEGAEIYLFKSDYKSKSVEAAIDSTDKNGNFVIDSTVTEDNTLYFCPQSSIETYNTASAPIISSIFSNGTEFISAGVGKPFSFKNESITDTGYT